MSLWLALAYLGMGASIAAGVGAVMLAWAIIQELRRGRR